MSFNSIEQHLELYNYPLIKLLDYWPRWTDLEQDPNPFALVVMAHLKILQLKRRPIELKEAKLELVRLLFTRGYSREYVVKLLRFIIWLVKLPPILEAEFRQDVKRLTEEVKMPYVTSFELLAKEEGKQEGMLTLTVTLLEQRFGKVGPELRQQLEALKAGQLQESGKRLLSLASWEELTNWLQKTNEL